MQGTLHEIMRVEESVLDELDAALDITGRGPRSRVDEELNARLDERLGRLALDRTASVQEVQGGLFEALANHEEALYQYAGVSQENFDFEKVATLARQMGGERDGFFLKREYAERILRQRPPAATIEQLGYAGVDELLEKENIMDVFSALRFTETDTWMHETFDVAYKAFTPEDFEKRSIEIRVLGPQWRAVAEKFVAKKHHNVSHLKEFGVIFINPIAETKRGRFIRDFALLLHYTHEIAFYSRLFERYAKGDDFSNRFISLLRGDVPEPSAAEEGEWLIIQRYLWKEDPADKRLFMPRVNPEALHWHRAEQDLVQLGKDGKVDGMDFWDNTDMVAGRFRVDGTDTLISFDLEDVAMGYVASDEGVESTLTYHQQEAVWNRLFAEYVGGYDKMEEYIIENMDTAIIRI